MDSSAASSAVSPSFASPDFISSVASLSILVLTASSRDAGSTEQLRNDGIECAVLVMRRAMNERIVELGAKPFLRGPHQAGFSDPRLSGDHDDPPLALLGFGPAAQD